MVPPTRAPLREDVRQIILDRILSGELPPGCRITESRLAAELGVSRTPLREALFNLESEGFVRSDLARGFSVAPLSVREVRESYPILQTLEVLAFRSIGQLAVTTAPDLRRINKELGAVAGDSERGQLRLLAQAALELGETRESCQPHYVVPQLGRRILGWQPADHWPEEGNAGGWLEVNDGRAHVLPRQRERRVRLFPDLEVPRLVIERLRQLQRQASLGEDRLRELARPAPFKRSAGIALAGGLWSSVEDVRSEGGIQRRYHLAAMLRACPGRHPQKPQPGGVASFVLRWKVRGVVDLGVDQAQ